MGRHRKSVAQVCWACEEEEEEEEEEHHDLKLVFCIIDQTIAQPHSI